MRVLSNRLSLTIHHLQQSNFTSIQQVIEEDHKILFMQAGKSLKQIKIIPYTNFIYPYYDSEYLFGLELLINDIRL